MADGSKEFTLNDLYDYLTPHNTLGNKGVTLRRPFEVVDGLLMGNVRMYSYSSIKSEFKNEMKGDTTESHLHGVGPNPDGLLFDGDEYFKSCKLSSTDELLPADTLQGKKFGVIATRNPFVTPARRGATDVDFFVNYTPSIFASQMVPYLDVEMQVIRSPVTDGAGKSTPATNLTSPSLMRFLMGSVPSDSPELGPVGQLLEAGQTNSGLVKLGDKKVNTVTAFSGMEMFLAPQTLTNMGGLVGGDGRRLTDVKPFVPFASIDTFDVSFANAGAGAMSHKKASLRLKLHDKSRMPEMAAFLKPGGFAYVSIITTYGWLAPAGRHDKDVFAKFVNDKMRVRDRWMVVNSSFSFDAGGQVTVTLELVTSSIRQLQDAEVLAQGELKKKLEKFNELIELIKKVSDAVTNKIPVADFKAIQVLNGIAGRSLPDLKTLGDAVDQMIKKLKPYESKFTDLPKGAFDDLQQRMDELVKTKKGTGAKPLAEQLQAQALINAKDTFKVLRDKTDPFLPGSRDASTASKFFSPKYLRHVGASAGKKDSKTSKSAYVSFGSIFNLIAAKAVLDQDTCQELQVIYYGLNDSCGPVSGQSIAEFPVEIDRLEREYADAIKATGRITLDGFMKLLIDTQIADKRAAAYGMAKAYAPWKPDDKEKNNVVKNDKEYDNVMLEWHAEYGSFTQPMITMYVEAGIESSTDDSLNDLSVSERSRAAANASTRVIKRIHIYDITATPYDGLRKIVNLGGGVYALGDIKPAGQWEIGSEWFRDFLNNRAKPGDAAAAFSPVPGYNEYVIKGNPKSLMEHVSSFAPAIRLGTNGSLILNVTMASKTTGLQGAINIQNQNAAYAGQGGVLPPANGLEDPNGMPLRFSPAQLTMQTLGCPPAALYQQYFVDLGTGTTLDNLYTCTTVKHTLVPGKFTTDWTFMYTDAYGKFAGAPALVAAATQLAKKTVAQAAASPAVATTFAGSATAAAKPAVVGGPAKDEKPKPAKKKMWTRAQWRSVKYQEYLVLIQTTELPAFPEWFEKLPAPPFSD